MVLLEERGVRKRAHRAPHRQLPMAQMIELSDRSKLKLTGPQALWFLDQLITNQVVGLAEGTGAQALLLNPKGKITAELRVLSTRDAVLVDLQTADPQAVLDFFAMRVFSTKVQISDATDGFAIFRVVGPDAAAAVEQALEPFELPDEGHSSITSPHGLLVRLAAPFDGLDVWVPAGAKDYISMTLAQSGIQTLSWDEYQAYRIHAGVPVFGVDFDSTFLPQEAALERGVHFKKGCYLGQEAVAMTQRGKVKRRLRHLEFSGFATIGELMSEGVAVGTVTSASNGFGIATVKTSVPPDTQVQTPSGPATVRVLPGTVEGPSVPSARQLRERLQGRQ